MGIETALIVGGVAAAGSAYASSKASAAAAKAQTKSAAQASDASLQAARESIASQEKLFEQSRQDIAPFRELGLNAQKRLSSGLGLGSQADQQQVIDAYRNLPGTRFALDESERAGMRAASAGGLLGSGNALVAARDRAQQVSDLGFSNYLNQLAGLGGAGQTATSGLAELRSNLSSGISNNLMNAGQARASAFSQIGNANAENAYNQANIGSNLVNQGIGLYGIYKGAK